MINYMLPSSERAKYWRFVTRELAKQGWSTMDGKRLHWPTIERIAAARGFSATIVTDPANMVGVIERLLPPPNF